jgi:hypothetical protein
VQDQIVGQKYHAVAHVEPCLDVSYEELAWVELLALDCAMVHPNWQATGLQEES